MATAILKFDLEDVDDKRSHLRCIKSSDMVLALWEFTRNSRKSLENSYKEGQDFYDGVDETYKRLFELFEDYHIDIDELTY
jgi:hypothetical protein